MLKWFFAIFLVVAVFLGFYPFFGKESEKAELHGLPWQIELREDGATEVFGIVIGQTTLATARELLGDDMDMAIVVKADEVGSLEMYYGHYRVGLLGGKMVLQAEADSADIERWQDNAARYDYMASGNAKRFYLSEQHLQDALQSRITGITFIPNVNLDEEVVRGRFGEAAKRIEKDRAVHFLYPDKGLHIAISDDGKDVLQYVSPERFDKLSEPILAQ